MNIAIAFGAGILSFLSPCVLPLVPAFLVDMAGEAALSGSERRRTVTHALAFEGFSGILMFASGALVGSFLMGVYLLISLNIFGRHSNEAFSSLRIEDFKNFLRLHIAKDGILTIFPIGIERVPRAWKPTGATSVFEPQLEPDDPKATAPHLIEPPVVVQKPNASRPI